MKFMCFQKIMRLLSKIKTKKITTKGTTTLITIFIFFIFSTLSLSLIYFTRIQLKLSSYKKNSITLEYASENGIKKTYHSLLDILAKCPSPLILTEEETNELKENALKNGIMVVKKLTGTDFPVVYSGTWEKMEWKCINSFHPQKTVTKDGYFKSSFITTIESEGKLNHFFQKKNSTLKASFEILAGTIPLSFFPLLIDKKLDSKEKEHYTEKNNIKITSQEDETGNSKISFSEGELIPDNADSLLSKTLKIDKFYPQNCSNAMLREALGLKKTEDPIPEGVYLIKDDLGLGGIFVQGDLEELVLAIEDDFQVVSFTSEKGNWILKFNPVRGETVFTTPEETHYYDLIPLGIIYINGKILSLGGGTIDKTGNITLAKEKDLPSILKGINLTIVSSDEIHLSSHLIHQGVRWSEGVPYIKDKKSNLSIFSTGNGLFDQKETKSHIIIDKDSPEDITIQASLTSRENGLSIEGKKKEVHILGSLHTSDISSEKNKLNIYFTNQEIKGKIQDSQVPKTTNPVLYMSSFQIQSWEEF